jgi:predicted transcriptional regulator
MRVYHGSYTKIETIDLSKAEKNKDFGQGFYVTKNRRHAEEWAERIAERNGLKQGVVTEFEFGKYFFNVQDFNFLRFDDYTENWLDFVVMNRTKKTENQLHDYDFVEGPIADDRITTRIYDYLDGLISKADFLNELKYHEPTHQICFCTVHSLQIISNPNREIISKTERIVEEIIFHLIEEKQYSETEITDLFYSSNVFSQLSDKTTKLYLKNWTEIYELLKKEIQK